MRLQSGAGKSALNKLQFNPTYATFNHEWTRIGSADVTTRSFIRVQFVSISGY